MGVDEVNDADVLLARLLTMQAAGILLQHAFHDLGITGYLLFVAGIKYNVNGSPSFCIGK